MVECLRGLFDRTKKTDMYTRGVDIPRVCYSCLEFPTGTYLDGFGLLLKGEYWKIFVGVLVGEEEEFSFSRVRGFGLGSEGTA